MPGIQSLQRYDPTTGRFDPERTLIASIIGIGSTAFLLGAASGGVTFAAAGLLRGPAGQRLSNAFSATRLAASVFGAEYAVQRGWLPDDEQSWQRKVAMLGPLVCTALPAGWITRKYCMAFPTAMILNASVMNPRTLDYVWGPAVPRSSRTQALKNRVATDVIDSS
ncbi:hypothetical protein FB45DRAFT_1029672 [Roridomyces roridus]|uniref:Uncharacterized protein n=1 Tax=Roridomyces roridus TaxID=1738132 RepID=A0AAD7FJ87_9AGAR|nr:hypothetical protein FB45DRAFT_1029672 [Roridomyces roridus]